MKLYLLQTNDPAFNLAAEELLLTQETDEIVLLWRNRPTVVIGCNQSLLREIDLPYLRQNDISPVRRISGGGAVYHDLGNINFSVLSDYRDGSFCDFSRFCAPVIAYLKTLGVEAEMSGRNDMTIDGAKFSGNAQAVRKNRLLHHGTLLFDTDLTVLSKALLPDPQKLEGKGISSVRSRVTNILPHLTHKTSADAFFDGLGAFFAAVPDCTLCTLSDRQTALAEALARDKYRSFEWLYQKSPDYTFTNKKRFAFGSVALFLKTEKALITEVSFSGDFFGIRDSSELCAALTGCRHTPEALAELLQKLPVADYFSGAEPAEIISLFF